jgi:ADP-heptose:LPS heptosyltransferase
MRDLGRILVYDETTVEDSCPAVSHVPAIKKNGVFGHLKDKIKCIILKCITGENLVNSSEIPKNPKCVLVATGGNLGGAIISLPLVRAVRKKWPNAHLAVLSNRQHGVDIIKYAGVGDSFHIAPEISLKRMFFSLKYYKFKKEISKIAPDIYIGNHNYSPVHMLPLAKIPIRIGHCGKGPYGQNLGDYKNKYTHPVQCQAGKNWLTAYTDLVNQFSSEKLSSPKINPSPTDKMNLTMLKSLRLNNGQRLVAIQAGVWSGYLVKEYPVELMAQVCVSLYKIHNLIPVILGGKGQTALSNLIKKYDPNVKFFDCVGKTDAKGLIDIVSACNTCVSNDSGLMHVSASLGVPTVAIYGVGDPSITWVYGESSDNRIIRREKCRPCFGLGLAESCSTKSCLRNISPHTIVNSVLEIIK